MQRFNLRLTTEELKSLQCLLETALATSDIRDEHLHDVLTKVIVTQVEAEEPFVYVGAHPETDRVF